MPREEAAERWMFVEDVTAFGVDVEEIKGAGVAGVLCFDAAQKVLEDWGFEGVVEEGQRRCVG